jgi:hypothetical protein
VEADLDWRQYLEIHETPLRDLASYVREVVEVEGPVHIDEVVTRIREAAGKGRAGRLIRERLEAAISYAKKESLIEVRDTFCYRPGQAEFVVRDRSDLPQQSKRIVLIAPEEIEKAAEQVLQESIAVPEGQLAKPVAGLLGFDRVSAETEAHIDSLLKSAIKAGRLELAFGKVKLPSTQS